MCVVNFRVLRRQVLEIFLSNLYKRSLLCLWKWLQTNVLLSHILFVCLFQELLYMPARLKVILTTTDIILFNNLLYMPSWLGMSKQSFIPILFNWGGKTIWSENWLPLWFRQRVWPSHGTIVISLNIKANRRLVVEYSPSRKGVLHFTYYW